MWSAIFSPAKWICTLLHCRAYRQEKKVIHSKQISWLLLSGLVQLQAGKRLHICYHANHMHARGWHAKSEDGSLCERRLPIGERFGSSISVRNAGSRAAGCLTSGGRLPLMVAEIKRGRFSSIQSHFRVPSSCENARARTHGTYRSLTFRYTEVLHVYLVVCCLEACHHALE